MNKSKGITMIALIITIIVLLILVGVSINLAIKGDLFGSAQKAVKGTNDKTAQEQTRVDELMNTVDDVKNNVEDHRWIETGDSIKCSYCNRTVTIGQQLNYKETGTGSSSITAEKAGKSAGVLMNNGIKLASLKLAAGSIPSTPTTTQTIHKDSDTKWVVLGAIDANKNGEKETLLLTTAKPTTEQIVLYGAAGYNNCVDEINRMCREIYGEGVRGMSIEDINNCLQYTPKGMYKDKSGVEKTTSNTTTKLSELPTDIWDAIKGNYKTPDGVNTVENFSNIQLNGYWYTILNNSSVSEAEKSVILGTSNDYAYWLASNGVSADANEGYAYFGPGSVRGGFAFSCDFLYDSDGYSRIRELSLRPVVAITTDIPEAVE